MLIIFTLAFNKKLEVLESQRFTFIKTRDAAKIIKIGTTNNPSRNLAN